MNNYVVYDKIGNGKHSVVHKGRMKKSLEFVTLKSFDKNRKNRVLNEVKILSELNHKNIIKFYNWYETKNHYWSIYEFCCGNDLKSIIKQDKKVNEQMIKYFFLEITSAILYLHQNGIIFGDMKPSNFIFTEYQNIKLCDFGLSKKLIDVINFDSNKNFIKGNPYYLAPELLTKKGVFSFQSDVWGLGCLMYELFCGVTPFGDKNAKELEIKITTKSIQKPNLMSDELFDLIKRMLKRDPSKRLSMNEIIGHKFFNIGLGIELNFPDQPQFEKFKKKNNQNENKDLRISLNKNPTKNKLNNESENIYEDYEYIEVDSVVSEIDSESDDNDEIDTPFNKNKKEFEFNKNLSNNIEKKSITESQNLENNSIKEDEEIIKIVENLIYDQTDEMVKPIMGNHEIEKIPEFEINIKFDDFDLLEINDLINLELLQKKNYLNKIYKYLVSDSTLNKNKIEILNYLGIILQESSITNLIVETYLSDLLIKMVKNSNTRHMKITLCILIGYLIRYTNIESTNLSSLGIISVMMETFQNEKSDQVKRKSIAALGEYLFYGATQLDGTKENEIWDIPFVCVNLIMKIIKSNEDEIIKLYNLRILENITTKSEIGSKKFITEKNFIILINKLNENSSNYIIQGNLIKIILNFIRYKPEFIENIIQNLDPKIIIKILNQNEKNYNKILNLINLTLFMKGEEGSNYFESILQDLVQEIIKILKISNEINKIKALLTTCLLLLRDMRALHYFIENIKFLQIIDKIALEELNKKEKNNKLIDAINFFSKIITQCANQILNCVYEETMNLINEYIEKESNLMEKEKIDEQNYEIITISFIYLSNLYNSNYLQTILINDEVVKRIFEFLQMYNKLLKYDKVEIVGNISRLIEEVINCIDNTYENKEIFINFMMKQLLDLLDIENNEFDSDFTFLKLFLDLFEIVSQNSNLEIQLKELIKEEKEKIILIFRKLITKEEPLDFYTVKLIKIMLETKFIDFNFFLISINIETPKSNNDNKFIDIFWNYILNKKEITINIIQVLGILLSQNSDFIYEMNNNNIVFEIIKYLIHFTNGEQIDSFIVFLNFYFDTILYYLQENKLKEKEINLDYDIINEILNFFTQIFFNSEIQLQINISELNIKIFYLLKNLEKLNILNKNKNNLIKYYSNIIIKSKENSIKEEYLTILTLIISKSDKNIIEELINNIKNENNLNEFVKNLLILIK